MLRVLALSVLALAASCALDGFNRVASSAAGGQTGAGGQGGAAGEGGTGLCGHASPPEPPEVADAGGDVSFTAALRRVFLIDGKDGEPLGYDLDGTCTCQGQSSSCVPTFSSAEKEHFCDLAGGRDNAMRRVFQGLATANGVPDPSTFYSDAADKGLWSMLIQLDGYNGQADDDRVEVVTLSTTPFSSVGPTPLWDGSDAWPVSTASYEEAAMGGPDLDRPRHFASDAYVRDHVLVAWLVGAEVALASAEAQFTLAAEGALLTARLEQGDAGWQLRQGVIAMRLPIAGLFQSMSSFRGPEGTPICTDDLLYSTVRTLFCTATDILEQGVFPSKPCNAASLAIGFEADPAKVGPLHEPEPPATSCPPDTDPVSDNCNGL